MKKFFMDKGNKIKTGVVTSVGAISAMSMNVFAGDTPIADPVVTAALGDAAKGIALTMAAVAAAGLTVWLAPMGFRFAKKMFKTVAS